MEPTSSGQQAQSDPSSGPVDPPVFRGPRGSIQKERSQDDEARREAKKAKKEDPSSSSGTQAGTGVTSGSSASPPASTSAGGAAAKRAIEDAWDSDEAPEKTQKLNRVCVGLGAADKIGERQNDDYENDLKDMVEEYRTCNEHGGCFVHIRKNSQATKT